MRHFFTLSDLTVNLKANKRSFGCLPKQFTAIFSKNSTQGSFWYLKVDHANQTLRLVTAIRTSLKKLLSPKLQDNPERNMRTFKTKKNFKK